MAKIINSSLSVMLVKPAIYPISQAAGAFTPATFDAKGYDRAMFIMAVGTGSNGSSITASVYHTTVGGGTYSLLSSSLHTAPANTGRQDVFLIDVPVSGTKPIMKLMATSADAEVAAGAVVLLYNGNHLSPPSQDNTVVNV